MSLVCTLPPEGFSHIGLSLGVTSSLFSLDSLDSGPERTRLRSAAVNDATSDIATEAVASLRLAGFYDQFFKDL